MATFRYKAQDKEGKTVTGQAAAGNENELHEKLKTDGLMLLEAAEISAGKRRLRRLKFDRLSDFSRNLSKLLGAGVTLVRALKIISDDESMPAKEREIYADILRLVRTGMPLSDALEEEGDTFPTLFVNMIRSAESTGNLDITAANLAEYYSKEYKINQKISSSMTYPKILSVRIVAVVVGGI